MLIIQAYWFGFSVLTGGNRVIGALAMYLPFGATIAYIFSVSLSLTFFRRKMSEEFE